MDGWIVCGTGNIFFIGFQFSMVKKNVMFPITNHSGWMDGWKDGLWVGGWVNGQDSITSSIGKKLPVPNEKTVSSNH
jgi:hypothetical protein